MDRTNRTSLLSTAVASTRRASQSRSIKMRMQSSHCTTLHSFANKQLTASHLEGIPKKTQGDHCPSLRGETPVASHFLCRVGGRPASRNPWPECGPLGTLCYWKCYDVFLLSLRRYENVRRVLRCSLEEVQRVVQGVWVNWVHPVVPGDRKWVPRVPRVPKRVIKGIPAC